MNSVFKRNNYTRKPLQPAKITKHKTSRKEKIVRWSLLCVFLVISYFAGWMNSWAKHMTNGVAYIASITVGDEMTTDATNNINVLLV